GRAMSRLTLTALASLSAMLLLAGCGRPTANVGNTPPPDGVTFSVAMQPQPAMLPAFAGTVRFAPPVAMEASGSAAAASAADASLDRPASDFRPDWQVSHVAASGSSAVFSPQWDGPA